MIALILAAAVMAGVFIRWAVANDRIAALENLDDEQLAGDAADAWNRGQW